MSVQDEEGASEPNNEAVPYEVGKGKPPKGTQWPKGGPSPNPKGRPKGSKNKKTMFKEAFETPISVTIDGQVATMPKGELSYHQWANKAAAGDLKAISMQIDYQEKIDPPESPPPTKEESEADFATLEEWILLRERMSVFKKKADDEN